MSIGARLLYHGAVPVRVTFWTDVVCPFCYLAAAPLGRLAREGAIGLRVRPFEIHPETPPEGVPLERFGRDKVDRLYREVAWMAGDAGLTLLKPARLPRSRLALEAVEMARASLGEAAAAELAGRAMGAYFKDGLDLGQESVLRGLAKAVGIDRDTQDKGFLARAFGPAVDAARRDAEDALVQAVPAMDIGGIPALGYQPYAALQKLVERAARR